MRKLMKKQNGFTLIEMLIVVAIIAILVAVSLPLINGSLENAREATDAANERAAKAEILLVYMTDAKIDGTTDLVLGTPYYYDAEAGKITATAPTAYGKSTAAGTVGDHTGMYIQITLGTDEAVTVSWTNL